MKIKWENENQELLTVIYRLVLDYLISDKERELLLEAKNKIENNMYERKVVEDLKTQLGILALKRELSRDVSVFFSEISRKTPGHKLGYSFYDSLIR
ncbi:bacteriocin immunity protein [Granulicatella sp. zg-ZJ]|uniref:bacteriocin immunity protein n=1 Tax=Granulicatella sp. zg-ZJ TaxID=2678504 RepID=UPI0013D1B49A|nr:bacteriocin immunity protein [Granulicatella sp. zg-ZJ]MBS4750167.1 bacteriocin immunity protein [Carnobacteriaceae bacterium zg-ZUI78]NEW62370.1 bacteriocin immunity protein [Granulicatella sp. zg-ZJ]